GAEKRGAVLPGGRGDNHPGTPRFSHRAAGRGTRGIGAVSIATDTAHNGKQARLSKGVNWRGRVSGGIPPGTRGLRGRAEGEAPCQTCRTLPFRERTSRNPT